MVEQKLTLYGRLECHLCQDMLNDLQIFRGELGFTVDFIDVDQDKKLAERYGLRVPVLEAGEQEICHYFLDKQALFKYFEQG